MRQIQAFFFMFIVVCQVLKRRCKALCGASLAALALCFLPGAQAAPAPLKLALIEGLSGPNAGGGEAVFRNLSWAIERVNARGGVALGKGSVPMVLERFDSQGQTQEALSALRLAIDGGARVVLQGNSSAVAAALIDAIQKHNARDPARRVLFLNYAAVDPALTNEKCSFWHFRFDAHADMRLTALMQVLREDAALKAVYLLGQDYSFGQSVLRQARQQLAQQRPDIRIAGEELHPLLRIKDFTPYIAKIKASGAQAVLTGNFGPDLTLLVKAAREGGFEGTFYTFYGNALGAPAAMGEAGVGKVLAVADWLPNVQTKGADNFYRAFRARFPRPEDDYVHLRMQLMVEALALAVGEAAMRSSPGELPEAAEVARALEGVSVSLADQSGAMRASDHQFQQPLVVGVMERQGAPGVKFDVEGSGYGFRVVKTLSAEQARQPETCAMQRF